MTLLCTITKRTRHGAAWGLLASLLAALPGHAQIPEPGQLDQLTDGQLKAFALQCDRQATQRVLAFDEAALCSMGWEKLKTRVFSGDADALLGWWRGQRDNAVSATKNPLESSAGQ